MLRSASLRAASPRTCTRSRSLAPLPKRAPRAPRRSSSVASGLRGSVALAESGLVTGLATKSCPPVLPPQLRLSRVSRALHAASVGSQPSADASGPSAPSAPVSEAPRATESASNSDDEWDALLDAHGLAPSLGGTAAAVAQPAEAAGASRRARDKRRRSMWRDILFRVFLPGVASLVGSFWARACFRGSCRIVGPRGLLLRLLSSMRALSSVIGAGFGVANSSASPKIWMSPTSATLLPEYDCARQSSSWWSSPLAKRLYRCRICCSWTSFLAHGYGDCRWCHDEAH